jgi:hypothetical protein
MLKLTGFITCSQNDIQQRLHLAAQAEDGRIIGEQPMHDVDILPVKRDGIARYCKECRP